MHIYILQAMTHMLISLVLIGYYYSFKEYKWSSILLIFMLLEIIAALQAVYIIDSGLYLKNNMSKNETHSIMMFLSITSSILLLYSSTYFDYGIEFLKKIKKDKKIILLLVVFILSMTYMSYVLPEEKWILRHPDIYISIACLLLFGISLLSSLLERKFYILSSVFFIVLMVMLFFQYPNSLKYSPLSKENSQDIIRAMSFIFSIFYIVTPVIWIHKEAEEDNRKKSIAKEDDKLEVRENRIVLWNNKKYIFPPQAFFDLLTFIQYKSHTNYNGCVNLNDVKIEIDHRRIHRLRQNFKDKKISLDINKGNKVGYYYLSIQMENIEVDNKLRNFLM